MKKRDQWPLGAVICYPHADGHAVQIVYQGRMGRRRFRRLLRETTPLTRKDELDYAIDNLTTPLVHADLKKMVVPHAEA